MKKELLKLSALSIAGHFESGMAWPQINADILPQDKPSFLKACAYFFDNRTSLVKVAYALRVGLPYLYSNETARNEFKDALQSDAIPQQVIEFTIFEEMRMLQSKPRSKVVVK